MIEHAMALIRILNFTAMVILDLYWIHGLASNSAIDANWPTFICVVLLSTSESLLFIKTRSEKDADELN